MSRRGELPWFQETRYSEFLIEDHLLKEQVSIIRQADAIGESVDYFAFWDDNIHTLGRDKEGLLETLHEHGFPAKLRMVINTQDLTYLPPSQRELAIQGRRDPSIIILPPWVMRISIPVREGGLLGFGAKSVTKNLILGAKTKDLLQDWVKAAGFTLQEGPAPSGQALDVSPGEREITVPQELHDKVTQVPEPEVDSETSASPLEKEPAPAQQKGLRFGDVCLRLVREMGFDAQVTDIIEDGGIDILATSTPPLVSGRYVIQCKARKQPIGEPIVRDLYGVVHSENANKGILITTSWYTEPALEFAKGKPLALVDGQQLRWLLNRYLPEVLKRK